jgi:hypothetical protein
MEYKRKKAYLKPIKKGKNIGIWTLCIDESLHFGRPCEENGCFGKYPCPVCGRITGQTVVARPEEFGLVYYGRDLFPHDHTVSIGNGEMAEYISPDLMKKILSGIGVDCMILLREGEPLKIEGKVVLDFS